MRVLAALCSLVLVSLAQTQTQIVSAGYDLPTIPSFTPGQVISLFVRGLNVPDAFAAGTPLPTTLSGVTVKVNSTIPNYPDRLPIFSVRSYGCAVGGTGPLLLCPLTGVTVQMPTEPTCVPTGFPNSCTIGSAPVIVLNVEVNGSPGQDFPVFVSGANPHILSACDTIFGTLGGICDAFVTHADGTLIGSGCANPAKPGETIVIYAVGFGGTKTGEAAPSSPPVRLSGQFLIIVSFRLNEPPGSPAPPVVWSQAPQWFYADYVGLVPGYVGLAQINFRVPSDLPANIISGTQNIRIALASDGLQPAASGTFVDLCVQ